MPSSTTTTTTSTTAAAAATASTIASSEINTGGFAAVGGKISDAVSLTAADYIYLVEGDTAATTGVYNAGKLLIKLYGSTLSF